MPVPSSGTTNIFLDAIGMLPQIGFMRPRPIIPRRKGVRAPMVVRREAILTLGGGLLCSLTLTPGVRIRVPLGEH